MKGMVFTLSRGEAVRINPGTDGPVEVKMVQTGSGSSVVRFGSEGRLSLTLINRDGVERGRPVSMAAHRPLTSESGPV